MTAQFDTLVIGAGVVGLAAARALAMAGHEVVVAERCHAVGQETSSRNSGVIHSGIYYPTGSLKAKVCVEGRHKLYEYCAERGIPHERCGKLIVAQQSQVAQLRALQEKGVLNGVKDLEWLDQRQAQALEPQVRCAAALLSPSTGIIDVHEYMSALEADLQSHGGVVALETEFLSAKRRSRSFHVHLRSNGELVELQCRHVVNCGGLQAVQLLGAIADYPKEQHSAFFAKGSYFTCPGKPFSRLVYPMPNEAGLGVHATLDLQGATRFGPDVEWVERLDYSVDPLRCASFYNAIREYWPDLRDGALQPAYAGIRPKLTGPGQAAADFRVEGHASHGIPGLVNLLGIESPGLTSSLALAELVVATLK